MRYVSIFSGIEAASVAWVPLGYEPMAFAEVDPFACAVLAERFPEAPNLGDVTKVDWGDFVRDRGRPDVVVGGSPCQSFSVAGNRAGLDGASGLMWEYVRAVRELVPLWLVWENVPGALSSTHGEDFGCLLRELDALGYGLAWRVLDAQFFGLAQRRERVFVVGRLGDVERPCEVLLDAEGLRRDPEPSREKRAALAAGAGRGAACAGFRWNAGGDTALSVGETSPTIVSSDPPAVYIGGDHKASESVDCAGTLPASTGGFKPGAVLCIPENAINRPTGGTNGPMAYGEGEPSPTLRASKDVPAVMCMTDTQPHSMVDPEVCGALSSTMHKDPPVVAKTLKIRGGCEGGGKGPLVQEDVSATFGTSNDQALFEPVAFAANQRGEVRLQGGDGDVVGAIPATRSGKQVQGVAQGYAVRRLTPRECERLMGMPDDWTKVPYRGKPAEECPDTPRYKAIGNSMAVNVMRWLGERMLLAESAVAVSPELTGGCPRG